MGHTGCLYTAFVFLGIFSFGHTLIPARNESTRDILVGLIHGYVTRDVDYTLSTWDPQLIDTGGHAFCRADHDVSEGQFYLYPNIFFRAWQSGYHLTGTARGANDRPLPEHIEFYIVDKNTNNFDQSVSDALFTSFNTEHVVKVNITSSQYFMVRGRFDLSGFSILQNLPDENALAPVVAGLDPLTEKTRLRILCGNENTATASLQNSQAVADTVTSYFGEHLLGHRFWRQGTTYYIPSFPEASRGYYLKITANIYDFPEVPGLFAPSDSSVQVEVISGAKRETVTLESMFEAKTVMIPSNTGSYISGGNIPISVVVYVRGSGGDQQSQLTAPAMITIAPNVFWLDYYEIDTVNDASLISYIIVVAASADVTEIYIDPDTLNDNVFEPNVNNWIPIAETDCRYFIHPVEPGVLYTVFSDRKPFAAYDYYHCRIGSGEVCASGSVVDVATSPNAALETNLTTTTLAPPPPTTPTTSTAPSTTTTLATAPSTTTTLATAPSTTTTLATTPSTATTASSTTQSPITPPPSEINGCPCLFIDGFDDQDPRYSYLNGAWVQQPDLYNGRPYYKHVVVMTVQRVVDIVMATGGLYTLGCAYYLYFWNGQVSYWLAGPELGENRGILLNEDTYRIPGQEQQFWRVYNIAGQSWETASHVTTSCTCNGIPSCSELKVSDSAVSFPGTFHFVNVHNGRPVFRNDVTGLMLYYNMEPGTCQRWVIGADYGLKSTRAYVYDASFDPVSISSTWKARITSPPNYNWNADGSITVYCS